MRREKVEKKEDWAERGEGEGVRKRKKEEDLEERGREKE